MANTDKPKLQLFFVTFGNMAEGGEIVLTVKAENALRAAELAKDRLEEDGYLEQAERDEVIPDKVEGVPPGEMVLCIEEIN